MSHRLGSRPIDSFLSEQEFNKTVVFPSRKQRGGKSAIDRWHCFLSVDSKSRQGGLLSDPQASAVPRGLNSRKRRTGDFADQKNRQRPARPLLPAGGSLCALG